MPIAPLRLLCLAPALLVAASIVPLPNGARPLLRDEREVAIRARNMMSATGDHDNDRANCDWPFHFAIRVASCANSIALSWPMSVLLKRAPWWS